jgi:hypothetical protein
LAPVGSTLPGFTGHDTNQDRGHESKPERRLGHLLDP